MGAPMVAAQQPAVHGQPKESEAKRIFRITKEGRKLWYCLRVLQTPDRARACGSGAKCES
jgi:hypothetical protein